MRVLGPELTGTGKALLAGLEWAVRQGFDVINMSLSTRKRAFADVLRELADDAYFQRSLLVCSAHNTAVESFPWRFASVVSVGSHDREDPLDFDYNARGPSGVLRPRDRRRGGVAGRRHDGRLGQLVRDAADRRDLRADPRQAPRPDPVRGEDDPVHDAQRGAA